MFPLSPRSASLSFETLENRTTPVVGKFDLPAIVQPGTGYDGVVQVSTAGGLGTGTLLQSGRHILTAAHVVGRIDVNNGFQLNADIGVSFDLPNVGRIRISVPAANVTVHPSYADLSDTANNDLAVITLPVIAPSGPGGAERYPLYRNTDEVGQTITIVGFGRTGTGNTGEQPDIDNQNQKRIARNRYDGLGDRLGGFNTNSLLYDVDNGQPANDAFGRLFGVNDLGLPDEGSGARGDSGGPVFVTVNGQRFIAGTTTSGPKPNPNPAELNPQRDAGFGSFSHDTRVSSFAAPFIDPITNPAAAIVLDLRFQSVGQDAVADAISVRLNGTNLELVVNGNVAHSVPLTDVTSLKLVGAGEGNPFTTTVTIENGVPLGLAITYERILQVADNRTATTNNPPADAPAVVDPVAPTAPENRPEPILDLGLVPNLITPSLLLAVSGSGGKVQVIDPQQNNKVVRDFIPFPGYTGPVSIAFGDVNGDLVKDLIVAAGSGGSPHVKVFDGETGAEIRSFFAYDVAFRGGVNVSSGDIDGDGVFDIITGAGAGGSPHVKVFSGATGEEIRSFFAYEVAFLGGVNVAAGDTNNDGFDDIITGAGAGGSPHVKVFDGVTNTVIRSFFAYDATFTGGVSVAAGDIDGDGSVDVITGAGAGGSPHVKVYSGETGNELWSFFAYDQAFRGGVRVAAIDADNDELTDIATGAGPGGGPNVKVFGGTELVEIRDLFAFDPAFTGGVFVGGQG